MATIYRPALWLPSYEQGFARDASEAANPNLWEELLFNWHGPLGVTGATAWDVSGFSNDPALTNMDPATDWVTTERGWALELDHDASQYLTCGNISSTIFAGDFTVAGWIIANPAAGVFTRVLIDKRSGAGAGFRFLIENAGSNFRVDLDGTTLTLLAANTGVWNYFTLRRIGTAVRLFVDGVDVDGGVSGDDASNNNGLFIGSRSFAAPAGFWDGMIGSISIWYRGLAFSEIKKLVVDEHAIVRPRLAVPLSSGAAPAAGGISQIIGGGMVV